jgi:hypothetical protein
MISPKILATVVWMIFGNSKNEVNEQVKTDGTAQEKRKTTQEMSIEKYSMSFTSGGLLYQESLKVAELYFEMGDWNEIRDTVVEKNLLQAKTLNSLKRIFREVCSRLKTLHTRELQLLVNGSNQEQAYLLWIAVCRRYKFIKDFATEVIKERFLTLRTNLSYEDYDAFFNAKAQWHEDLEKITPTTRMKLRQVLFKMLREAGLLSAGNTITPAMLTPGMLSIMGQNAYQDLSVFPVVESELKGLVP